MPRTTTAADLAPHGYEADGVTPKAPFGYRKDGVPRKSNRGARPGQFGGGSAPASKASRSDRKRVESLVMLGETLVCTPLALASSNPLVKRYLGAKHTDALGGDALILSQCLPLLSEGAVEYAADHPGFLSWMDTVEERASSLKLLYGFSQLTRLMISNHISPDPQVAEAGRHLAKLRSIKQAQAVKEEAARYGLTDEDQEDDEDDGQGLVNPDAFGVDDEQPVAA